MAMPRASRRIALSGDIPGIVRLPRRSARLGGDGGTRRTHDPPQAAEAVDPLPGDVPRCLVLDEVVERMAAVSDLDLAIGAGGGAEKRGAGAGPGLGRAVGEQWRPDVGAARVAGGRRTGVGDEEIQADPLVIDQDLTQLRVVRDCNLRPGCGRARRRARRPRGWARPAPRRYQHRRETQGPNSVQFPTHVSVYRPGLRARKA